jgi:hypothetical protein
MFEISLAPCEHRVHFRNRADLPRVNAERYCRFCRAMRTVSIIHPWWQLLCKQCQYGASRMCRFGIASLANKHMLTRRHTVLFWKSTERDETLEIVQPATTHQVQMEVTEDGQLVEQPPF